MATLFGTFHKTGTVLIRNTLIEYCQRKNLQLIESLNLLKQLDNPDDWSRYIVFTGDFYYFKRTVNLENVRGVVIYRHPYEIIMSGMRYHQISTEKNISEDTFFQEKDLSYREYINSLETVDDKIDFEMNNFAKKTIMDIYQSFSDQIPNIEYIKHEDLILNPIENSQKIANYLNLDPLIFTELFLKVLNTDSPHITNKMKNYTYQDYFKPYHYQKFQEIFPSDLFSKLGYPEPLIDFSSDKDQKKVFIYWEDKEGDQRPAYINICHELIQKYTNCILVTRETLFDYIPEDTFPKKFFQIEQIGQRADYIRIRLLYEYGGIWLDSDTILYQDVLKLYDQYIQNSVEFAASGPHGDNPVSNAFLIGKKGAEILKKILEFQTYIIDETNQVKGWVSLGWKSIMKVVQTEKYQTHFAYIPPETVLWIGWENYKQFWSTDPDFKKSVLNSLNSKQLVMLYNNFIKINGSKITENQILYGQYLISDLFRYGYNQYYLQNNDLTNNDLTNNEIPMIYCINVKLSTLRKYKMNKQFDEYQLMDRVKFVDAVSKEDPLIDYYGEGTPIIERSNGRAHIGCFASHLKGLKIFIESGANEAIICEDDILLHKNFKECYFQIRKFFPSDIRLVCLSYLTTSLDKCFPTPECPYLLTCKSRSAWGTQMYWISRKYAIEAISKYDQPIKDIKTKDEVSSEIITRISDSLIAKPMLAIEESLDSDIGHDSSIPYRIKNLAKLHNYNDFYSFDHLQKDINLKIITNRRKIIDNVTQDQKLEVKNTVNPEVKNTVNPEVKNTVKPEVKNTVNPEVKNTVKPEVKKDQKPEVKNTVKHEVKNTVKHEVKKSEKLEVKKDQKPEIKKSEANKDQKPEIKKSEVKKDQKPEIKKSEKPEVKKSEIKKSEKPEVKNTVKPEVKRYHNIKTDNYPKIKHKYKKNVDNSVKKVIYMDLFKV